ncbi:McrC family protein [Bacillus sp. UNCCL81]|uniref:McrC family protein n=1 Tax=Bacillus sp. UNCCL81 TaxID=1502755 RepID=UPI0008DF5EB4|nr:McrC family protein [Bacillus sp. UNCCL81]SFC95314.1 5-methylcytosine-specific restriction enzyme subunit McrC [Bacillus sp. UNCCL81]
MNKLLEVREFEAITCNEDYKNDTSLKYINEEIFTELENYILVFNESDEADAMDFLKIGVRRNVGKVIQARNYVGIIQTKSNFQLQILPKISNNAIEDTKKTFLSMLRSLKDFPSKIFNESNLKMDRMNLYEIFINMYIQEVLSLIKKGLRSSYLSKEENINFFKGKLIVQNHIKKNLIHKERFYMRYDEFGINRPENRLIKSTLLKLQKISNSATNIKEIRHLLTNLEMVKSSTNFTKDFSKVVIDRNTKDYEMLMQWSKVFLMNQSFTTFSGNTTSRALLFPMEKVFESYVSQNLKRVLADLGWEISVQDKGYYLFDNPRKFALRPDIVITRDDGSRIIIDAKWKLLNNNPQKNFGISQADMYQMYAYSKKYETSEIWLLYPLNDEMENADISFVANNLEFIETNVRVFFVDVTRIGESLGLLKEQLVRV